MPQLVSAAGGRRDVSLRIDDAGYRDYTIVFIVEGTPGVDGPLSVRYNTPGLPLPGQAYQVDAEFDTWAWCRPAAEVIPHPEKRDGDPTRYWQVTLVFSNRPQPPNVQRCQDVQIEDPLLEPMRVSGSFAKYVEEASEDKWGYPIKNSAHEIIHGPQVEFEGSYPTIKIEQNVANLGLEVFTPMRDTVNKFPLWGFGPRCIKLDNVTWDKKYYGQCSVYYTRVFEFSINPGTFDRSLLDEGTMVLNGEWIEVGGTRQWFLIPIDGELPDPNNPAHFIQYKDFNGENARVVLDGRGEPFNPGSVRSESVYSSIWSTTQLGSASWDNPGNASGEPDGEVATLQRDANIGACNSHIILSGFVEPDEPPELGRVMLRIHSTQAGALDNNGGLIHEYSLDATTWVELERVVGNRTSYSEYDMTNVLTTWGHVGNFNVRVRAAFADDDALRILTLDGVELWVTPIARPGSVFVAKYQESDFSLLGIPLTF